MHYFLDKNFNGGRKRARNLKTSLDIKLMNCKKNYFMGKGVSKPFEKVENWNVFDFTELLST